MNFLKKLYDSLFFRPPTLQVDIRPAAGEDAQFIFDLALEQVGKGHLNSDFLLPDAQAGLAAQLQAAIGDAPVPFPGLRDGAGARVYMLTVEGEPVGFAWLLEERPGSWEAEVELHLLALKEGHQGHGLGKFFVGQLFAGVKSKRIYARCRPASTRMLAILKSQGFVETGTSKPSGTITVERRRQ